MDAARLVAESERVMHGAPQPEDVIAEAWQAGELVEAVERLLAPCRAADGHAVTVGRAGPAITAVAGAGPPRAARLTGMRDPVGTLRALRVLLGEISEALVGLSCAVQDEAAYWSCVDALDAVDEAKERVRSLARGVQLQGGAAEGGLTCGD